MTTLTSSKASAWRVTLRAGLACRLIMLLTKSPHMGTDDNVLGFLLRDTACLIIIIIFTSKINLHNFNDFILNLRTQCPVI